MARPKVAPVNKEREFGIEELFFSCTDHKGIIKSGNSVFTRISAYDPEELMDKPHNTIRHPDMPACVFKLLWDYLEAGKPIAAYVKNMAKTGEFYWVVATACPIDSGYLSVRLKPSSALFGLIPTVYAELKTIEQRAEDSGESRKSAMVKSTKRLLEILASKGFTSYDEFMQYLLLEELRSRQTAMNGGVVAAQTPVSSLLNKKDPTNKLIHYLDSLNDCCKGIRTQLLTIFSDVDTFLELNTAVRKKSDFLLKLAQNIRLLSLNAIIAAEKLLDEGRGLGTVADLMSHDSNGCTQIIAELKKDIDTLAPHLRGVAFQLSTSNIQTECALDFIKEMSKNNADGKTDNTADNFNVQTLLSCVSSSSRAVFEALTHVYDGLNTMLTKLDLLGSGLRTLELVHVTGKVEAARVNKAQAFVTIFDELLLQVVNARKELDQFSAAVNTTTGRMRSFPEIKREVMGLLHESSSLTNDKPA